MCSLKLVVRFWHTNGQTSLMTLQLCIHLDVYVEGEIKLKSDSRKSVDNHGANLTLDSKLDVLCQPGLK